MDIKQVLIVGGVVVGVGAVTVFSLKGIENTAIGLEESVNETESDINMQEKRRVDLLFNLVDVVKEYSEHEYKTLKDVVEARAKDAESGRGSESIAEVKTMIQATAEQYPSLKADTVYKDLMNELSNTENLILQSRQSYNKSLKVYKRYVRKFPNEKILSMFGYEQLEKEYLKFDTPSDAPQDLFKRG